MNESKYGCWRWQKIRKSGINQAESFLRIAEPVCVSACARFLRGDTEQMESLIKPLGYESTRHIDYDLMILDGEPSPQSLQAGPGGLILRRPRSADMPELSLLQAAYEREEVIPPGAEFNAAASRLSLEQMLEREHVLAAELGGHIVGKVNTNAAAFSRYQIGGVYVHPSCRGLGIATRMTAVLARELIAQGWGLNLFVKKNNPAAKGVYRRIGFTLAGDYRITYY
jgi:predicted GNAT family acetyltransferase